MKKDYSEKRTTGKQECWERNITINDSSEQETFETEQHWITKGNDNEHFENVILNNDNVKQEKSGEKIIGKELFE